MDNEILVKMENVEKEYSQGDNVIKAVNGIDLEITSGEYIAILGKSGSGKSTLLSLIGGLEDITLGTITLAGRNLSEMTMDDLALLRRKEVGIVFQRFHLMEGMTAVENVEMPLLVSGMEKSKRRPWAIELLKLVGLEDRATHYPNELSGGQRQRVGIARALANKPELILCDEPTGQIDSTQGAMIIDLLEKINKEGDILPKPPTIVMVTHDAGQIREGMRVLTLSDGKIIGDEIFDGDYERFDHYGSPSLVTGVSYESDNPKLEQDEDKSKAKP